MCLYTATSNVRVVCDRALARVGLRACMDAFEVMRVRAGQAVDTV